MAAALGPGTRVFIGWCPRNECRDLVTAARCRVGTVLDGPRTHELWRNGEPYWRVQPDGLDFNVWAVESLLRPLDDGPNVEMPDRIEKGDVVSYATYNADGELVDEGSEWVAP